MKRAIVLVGIILMAILPGMTWGADINFTNTFSTMAPSGTSYYVIDTTGIKTMGNFSAQASGTTQYGPVNSGTTVSVFAVGTDTKPSAAQVIGTTNFPLMDWSMVIKDMNLSTGVTTTMNGFRIQPSAFLVVKVVSGNTAYNQSIKLDIAAGEGTGWEIPSPVHLGTRTYNITSTTGTSLFSGTDSYGDTIPDGARYALIKSADSGNSLWVTRRTAVDYTRDPAVQAGDILPMAGSLAELKRIGVAAATTGVKAIVDFFSAKPF